MEVSGRKVKADVSSGDTTYCQPCSQDGEKVSSEVYCTVCKEFLCSTCSRVHKKLKVTKSHRLIHGTSMPTMQGPSGGLQLTEPCDIHPDEFIKYFCPSHQTLNCGHCLVTEHRTCHVDIISELAEDFKYGHEYDDTHKDIVQFSKDIEKFAGDITIKLKLIKELAEMEFTRLQEFREKVNIYLVGRENSLRKVIQQIKDTDATLLDSMKPTCDHIKAKVEALISKFEEQERNTAQLFIKVKKAQKQLKCLQSDMADINKKLTIHRYQFRNDPVTEKMLQSTTGFGTIERITTGEDGTLGSKSRADQVHGKLNPKPFEQDQVPGKLLKPMKQGAQTEASVDLTNMKFTPAGAIKATAVVDGCWLSSLLLLPGDRLLLTDLNSDTMQLLNLQTTTLMSQVSVPGPPWGICLLPRYMLAVTLTSGRIQFLASREKLSLGQTLKVHDDCRGIGYHKNRLIVSYHSGKVETMDITGKVIKTIDKAGNGQSIFGRPDYLTVVEEGNSAVIYVSDITKSTITKLDMDLNILQVFQGPALRGPQGITAVDHQLIICGYGSHNIIGINLSTGKMTELLGKENGIQRPLNVCYSQQEKKLYVTSFNSVDVILNKSVKVYKAA
ncbi:uncharacterized protein LOC128237913 [Mya arenaria]|uniref:uncharacterized protein LOC128237913 n=1 Tax=Mya arenaria TaxID=6604 RepID=UPI0022E6F240|nr:uncharacterized protein LOC128237913 [Mya arenaria]